LPRGGMDFKAQNGAGKPRSEDWHGQPVVRRSEKAGRFSVFPLQTADLLHVPRLLPEAGSAERVPAPYTGLARQGTEHAPSGNPDRDASADRPFSPGRRPLPEP